MPATNPDERIITVANVPPKKAELCMIKDIIIDAVVRESHESEMEISEYPVEKGADITDNIRPKPRSITLECVISNTPTNPDVIAARRAATDADGTPVEDVYVRLLGIREAREPVPVNTSLESYESMALESLSVPRTAATGDALIFTAKFREVEIVSNTRTKRVAIPIAKIDKKVTSTPKPKELTYFNVIRATDGIVENEYFWFDIAINGWRQDVEGSIFRTFTKGRPFGATWTEWILHRYPVGASDNYWQARLAARASTDNNPFDPWGGIGNNVFSEDKFPGKFG